MYTFQRRFSWNRLWNLKTTTVTTKNVIILRFQSQFWRNRLWNVSSIQRRFRKNRLWNFIFNVSLQKPMPCLGCVCERKFLFHSDFYFLLACIRSFLVFADNHLFALVSLRLHTWPLAAPQLSPLAAYCCASLVHINFISINLICFPWWPLFLLLVLTLY